MKKKLKTSLIVMLLILFDQTIKIFVSSNLIEKEFFILKDILIYKPHLNTKYSWYNSVSHLEIGLLPHIALNIVLILISLIIFDFVKEKFIDSNLVRCSFIFLFAGSFCSLIDKIAWGGSLDFISLKGFFTFDLKDIYISIFQILIILAMIFNYKKLKKINEKIIYNEFKTYINMKFFNKNF